MTAPAGRWAQALQAAWWRPRRGALAWLLWPLSIAYRAAAALHGALARPETVGRPVIVVGNLIVGGAGKTPAALALLRILRAQGWTPGVVSRGYGGHAQGVVEVAADGEASDVGDEPLLIRRRGGAPVVVGRDRVAAARALLQRHPGVDVIVSDDGLQHHRLARDLQVIVFDERGLGNGLCLPAGPLRAPCPDALPPRTLLLYNAGSPSTPLPGFQAARRLAPPQRLEAWQGARSDAPPSDWDALRGRRVLAVAGIAAPERFFAMLRAQGLAFDALPLPDHHRFDPLPWPNDADLDVVLTEKDAVKLAKADAGQVRVWVAPLDFEPEAGFADAIARSLPRPAHR